jgi:two-component system sensor histidine kinase MtrB
MTIRRHRRRFPLAAVPALLLGLRPRLVLAFVLVALIAGAAASLASYASARDTLLEDSQDATLEGTRDQLESAAADMRFPPDQDTLEQIASSFLPDKSLVVYGKIQAPQEASKRADIPDSLRQAVKRRNHLMWQRVDRDGKPHLALGITMLIGDDRPSGLEVYRLTELTTTEQSIDKLAWSAGRTTALSLIPAVLLALLAARGVLRPVRELRTAARRLAAGELDTRLRVRGSDELADLVLTFNNTAADLERSVGELRRMETNARRFVADVSHELRTPLAAMTAVTDTLDEEADGLDGDAGTAARLVSTETRRLVQLVENLIEISRFDAGRAVLRIEDDVDLAEAVAASIAARGWTDQVETDLPPGLTTSVDRRRLDVIVANLVGNSLRHGEAPVAVTIAEQPAGWVAVVVTDRGPGLPPDIEPHVFDRFYKADAARSRSEGSGLGLAIALENARLHGGTIEAANRASGGARFIARLPRTRPAAAPAQPTANAVPAQ